MKSLNRITLIGNLAADVECRQTKKGKVLANFPIATNRVSNDGDGKKITIADFHRVAAWGRLGEICKDFLTKGSLVYLEGKLVNRTFDNKEGVKQYRTEIVASDVNILNWKKSPYGEKSVEIQTLDKVEEPEEEEVLV